MATEFNFFFTNLGLPLRKIFRQSQQVARNICCLSNDAICNSDLTTEEFETAFKSLISNKVAGTDNINSNIVLNTSRHFSQYVKNSKSHSFI